MGYLPALTTPALSELCNPMTLSWVVQNCPEHGQPDPEADGQVKPIGRLMTLRYRIVSFLNKLRSSER